MNFSRTKALHSQDTGGNLEELQRWFFVSSLELFASIFSFGNLFILLYSFFLFVLLQSSIEGRLNIAKLNNLLIRLFLFLLISYFVVSLSEFLVYEAFWHLITYRAALFFFWILLGLQMALRFFAKKELRGSRCERVLRARSSMVIVLISVVLVITISWKSKSSLIERAAVWETRSAPLPGLGDIDPKGSWVDLCWQRLKVERDLPERVV